MRFRTKRGIWRSDFTEGNLAKRENPLAEKGKTLK